MDYKLSQHCRSQFIIAGKPAFNFILDSLNQLRFYVNKLKSLMDEQF